MRLIANNLWKLGPRAEAALKGAGVKFSLLAIGATRKYFVIPADGVGPIFEQFMILEPRVEGIGEESGSPDGVAPTGEELRDVMLGDSRERDEFRARRRATSAPSDGGQGIKNQLPVWSKRCFHIY